MKNVVQGQSNESKTKGLRNLLRIILIVSIAASILMYFFAPAVKSKISQIFMIFSSMSVDSVIGYIKSYGAWAAAVSFLLMILQSVVAPLPAFLITFGNAAIFGWWQGAILSWTSSMVGAVICFYIGRFLGRDAVEKLTSKFAMKSVEEFFKRYGKHTILICRLLPFVSFDFISYAAGLTSMGFLPFIIATGIGQLPATIVYSYVGGMLTGGTKMFVTALLCIFAISILLVLVKQVYTDRHKKEIESDDI